MIETFWQSFCKEENIKKEQPEAWIFGDGSKSMGDELGQLVLDGKKTATCSAYDLYQIDQEEIPYVGQYDIILDGDNKPIAVTQVKQINILKMKDVTADFARKEGEGDLSYQYWYDVHLDFFTKAFAARNLPFSPDQLLVCEEFEIIYTPK